MKEHLCLYNLLKRERIRKCEEVSYFFPVILLKLIWKIKDLKIDYNIWDVLKRIYGNMNWDLKKKKLWPVVKFYILVISNFFFTLTNYF